MPRTARDLVDGGIYHILNRGNGRQKVFYKDADYAAFLGLFQLMQENYAIDLYAYCLMPNHYHLVVKLKEAEEFSNGMRWFKTTHVRRYHKHYKTSGHLWQGRYKNFAVKDDDHLLTLVRYVEGNPVRADLVESATDWVWSSHRERTGMKMVPQMQELMNNRIHLNSELPINLPDDWTAFVDTPLNESELKTLR